MSDRSSGCGSSGNMSRSSSDSDLEYIMNTSDTDINLNMVDSDPDFSDRASDFTDEILSEESITGGVDDGQTEKTSGGNNESGSNNAGENTNDFYFEGVEKLLEIWFTKVDGKFGEDSNLRRIPRYQLEEMLKLVHCEIIDSVSNDEIDSYVLSESSLFVSERRIILKTCGTTTPLQCLKFLWTLVKDYTDMDCIEDVYYSHKNYKRPQMQKLPYRKFDNEVAILEDFFHGAPGSAYCLGSMNRDCWYLYTYHAPNSTKQGIMHRFSNFHHFNHLSHNHHHHHIHHHGKKQRRAGSGSSAGRIRKGQQTLSCNSMLSMIEADQTLEILMSDLDQSVMDIFTQKSCKTAEEATLKSGIHRIIPGMIINDHLFEPCGYSMNGIIKDANSLRSKNRNGTYMTIHITPESEFSYVSFETNISMSTYKDIIGRVLEVFQPGKFVLTFFANKASKGYNAHQELNQMDAVKDQWLRMDNQFCRLKKNDLTYAMYTKFPS